MAKTAAGVAAMVAILTIGAALQTDAAPNPELGVLVVVLHVTDYAHVPPRELAVAERVATQVYAAVGVHVVWTDGAARTAQPDGAFHVDVLVLSRDMVARKCQISSMVEGVFGTASHQARRAYIFYNRLTDHAARTNVGVSRLLGMVLTHEVGHVLLGADSHSPSGIMHADWYGRIVDVPGFTAEQGTTMRSLLATATAN
jgi:hypothetical protein